MKCAESLFLENHNNVDSLIYLYNQLNYTDSAVYNIIILLFLLLCLGWCINNLKEIKD